MGLLSLLDLLIAFLGLSSFLYQVVCVITSFAAKSVDFPDAPFDKHYCVLIAARNEQKVIGNLISSIRSQTYPSELIDIWVVADNCDDSTAQVCREAGCHVVERNNRELIGKGYALSYAFDNIIESGYSKKYDAYIVFDADNLLDSHYIEEMNKGFHAGFNVLTSYRNSVNLNENWVSSGSALWFMRESRFLHSSRAVFGTSCHVGGTGFLFSREIMERNGGWKFHLMTEDLEFSTDCVLHGDRIGFCSKAMLYDEQPVTFVQSWRQRVRWSKGFLQVFRYYGGAMMQYAIKERDFSAVDLSLMICPLTVISILRLALGIAFAAMGYMSWSVQLVSVKSFFISAGTGVLILMLLAALTCFAERDKIDATNKELFAFVLSFPVYMLSYIPISFVAIFSKPQWKPIAHEGITQEGGKAEKILKESVLARQDQQGSQEQLEKTDRKEKESAG